MERRARLPRLDKPKRVAPGRDPEAPPMQHETRTATEFTDDELAAILADSHQQNDDESRIGRGGTGEKSPPCEGGLSDQVSRRLVVVTRFVGESEKDHIEIRESLRIAFCEVL